MKTAVAVLTLAALALSAGQLSSHADGAQVASRVFDRTYVCTVTAKNGVRRIGADARRGFRERPAVWRWHAHVGLENYGGPQVSLPPNDRGFPGGVSDLNWRFGGSAGLTPAQWMSGEPTFKPGAGYTTRRACIASSAKIPFAPSGLAGGVASYFEDEYECDAPKRVLVRFRTVFASPTSFMRERRTGALRTLLASAPIREVRIAVRTESGRPFLYLEALSSGKARIFTAKACTPK